MKRKHPETEQQIRDQRQDDLIFPDYVDASCDICGATTFATYNELKSHYADIHNTGTGPVTCCQKKFLVFCILRDHIAWHNNPDIFK